MAWQSGYAAYVKFSPAIYWADPPAVGGAQLYAVTNWRLHYERRQHRIAYKPVNTLGEGAVYTHWPVNGLEAWEADIEFLVPQELSSSTASSMSVPQSTLTVYLYVNVNDYFSGQCRIWSFDVSVPLDGPIVARAKVLAEHTGGWTFA